MDEIKVKFNIKYQELIRPKLAGVYFLMQGEEVVLIGESKDIKRQMNKHLKQGLQFDAIGIHPLSGSSKQRKEFAKALIRKYQPKYNKVGRKKAIPPARAQKKRRRKPAKEVALPQSRIGMIRPEQKNGSLQSAEVYAKQIDEDTKPEATARDNHDQLGEREKSVISDKAREALIEWTKKITEEAYEEMTIEKRDLQPEEQGSDLPRWLTNLADETLFENISIKPGIVEQNSVENVPQPSIDDTLPDWALGSSQPGLEIPAEASANQVKENEDIPDWMRDIDTNKPRGKSVSPFG